MERKGESFLNESERIKGIERSSNDLYINSLVISSDPLNHHLHVSKCKKFHSLHFKFTIVPASPSSSRFKNSKPWECAEKNHTAHSGAGGEQIRNTGLY